MGDRKPDHGELYARAAKVKLLVFDVDGVLTDGSLFYGPHGEALKRFDVKDGHGLVMARILGLPAAVLSGRTSPIVELRAQELGLVAVIQGQRAKSPALLEMLTKLGLSPHECAYMGDDLNDLGALSRVGLSACPADAAIEVRSQVMFIAHQNGGHGAARELVELCLKASGRWAKALDLMKTEQVKP